MAVPDEHAEAIGHFVVKFAHLEDEVSDILDRLLGRSDSIGRYLLNNIQASSRVQIIKNVLHDAVWARNAPDIYDEVLAEFEEIRVNRNLWVHGIWHTHGDGRVTVQKSDPDVFATFVNGKDVTALDIRNESRRCHELYIRMKAIPLLE